MRSHIITAPASLDVVEIVDYLSDRTIESGEEFIQDFTEKCRYLTSFPLIGKSYPELQSGLRGIQLKPYIIFYTVTDEVVEIVRVLRGDRDLKALFNQ
jgi:toxin ParE1/3/4